MNFPVHNQRVSDTPSLWYPILVNFGSQNHDASPVKNYNLTQPKWKHIVITIGIGLTCCICAQAQV